MKRYHRLLALALALLPLAACGGGGHGQGIVGRLTGDPDGEVSSTLEDQVRRALERGEFDPPIDD